MTDVRIARCYPNLTTELARVAMLSDSLDVMRSMEMATGDVAGTKEEVASAKQATSRTIVELISKISEQDLKVGLEKELISEEDYKDTVVALRRMELARNLPVEREDEREL